jgi:hypothetical protein
VLVVSFGYAPLSHVSAARATHMARELASLGWDVSVLTVDWSAPLPAQVCPVERSVESALAEGPPRRVAIDGRLANPAFDPAARPPTTAAAPPRNAAWRKLHTLRNTLGWGCVGSWARQAYAAARLLHARRPIDVVWAIHGDDSSHEIAHRLRRSLGIPWVADFKDPWGSRFSPSGLGIARRVTARRLSSAAALTETCAAQAEIDGRDFGRPAHVVYSGYDAELMASVAPERPGAAFCVAYLGTIASPHDVRLLPGTFEELRRRGRLENGALELHQYSHPQGQLRQQLASVGCADLVRDHEPVPRARAFALMRGADVLLVFPMTQGRGRYMGLKEIESVASGSPLLVLGEPLAELEPLLRSCPQVCIARERGQAADFLEQELRRAREGTRSPTRAEVNHPALQEFTWLAQARRLSQVLADASGRSGSMPIWRDACTLP